MCFLQSEQMRHYCFLFQSFLPEMKPESIFNDPVLGPCFCFIWEIIFSQITVWAFCLSKVSPYLAGNVPQHCGTFPAFVRPIRCSSGDEIVFIEGLQTLAVYL